MACGVNGTDGEGVVVLGDGGWGTALALVLVESGCDVTLWGPFPEYVAEMEAKYADVRTCEEGVGRAGRDPAAGRTPVLAMRIDLARKQWEMTVRKADLSNLATVGFGELSLFLKIGDTFFGPSIVETSETVNLRWRR